MKIRIYKTELMLVVISLIYAQLLVDIPGMDIPDIKDLPGFNWQLII